MKYASILKCDIANGTGFRVSLFCSGCGRKCPGCFNQEAQDPNFGKPFDQKAKEKIFNELSHEYCKGLSLLGGDPLSKFSDNRKVMIELCREVKEKFPDKDIWCWTGYTIEEVENDHSMKDILKYIDVLIDGPFIQEKRDLTVPFRGSTNQRIIKIKDYISSKNSILFK